MFWRFLRTFWKFGSRLKNPVLGPDVEQILWNTQKTPTKHALRHLNNFFLNPILDWKIRFSAQMLNNAKNTMKLSENAN